MPKKLIPYERKKDKPRYVNFFKMVLDSGKTIDVLKRATLKQWKKYFPDSKITSNESLRGQKALLNQVKRDYKPIVNDYIIKEKVKNPKIKQAIYEETIRQYKIKDVEIKDIDVVKYEKVVNKRGSYGAVELTDLKNDNKYYIKYKSKKQFEEHFNKLIQDYQITTYEMKFIGIFMRLPYVKEKFKKDITVDLEA